MYVNKVTVWPALVDRGGGRGTRPWGQILSISVQFLGKFAKIVCWRPLEGWRPHLGEILDPPTYDYVKFSKELHEIEKILDRNGDAP